MNRCRWARRAGGTPLIDRERVARDLKFEAVCQNSIDAVSDRDFAIELCAAGALLMAPVATAEEWCCGSVPASASFSCRTVHDRLLDHAAEAQSDVAELARGKRAA